MEIISSRFNGLAIIPARKIDTHKKTSFLEKGGLVKYGT